MTGTATGTPASRSVSAVPPASDGVQRFLLLRNSRTFASEGVQESRGLAARALQRAEDLGRRVLGPVLPAKRLPLEIVSGGKDRAAATVAPHLQRLPPGAQLRTLALLIRDLERTTRRGWSDEVSCTVRVALPGIDPNQVHVDMHGNSLTISGERTRTEPNGHGYSSEFRYGKFERAFTLPTKVDTENV